MKYLVKKTVFKRFNTIYRLQHITTNNYLPALHSTNIVLVKVLLLMYIIAMQVIIFDVPVTIRIIKKRNVQSQQIKGRRMKNKEVDEY